MDLPCFDNMSTDQLYCPAELMTPPAKKIKMAPEHWSAFPAKDISKTIERIKYPPKKSRVEDAGMVKIFVGYMDIHKKIYFNKRKMSEQYLKHMTNSSKDSEIFNEFFPDIKWIKLINRLKRDYHQAALRNTDTRTSYKFGNKFLVPNYFTFGQQTVAAGTSHIYQTLSVPIIFFVMTKRWGTIDNGFLPYEEIKLYDQRILLPDSVYKIPAGTTYFIITPQKTFFSIDVVNEPFDMPQDMRWDDPVTNPVRKLPETYDRPIGTPYIEEEEDEDYGLVPHEPECIIQPMPTFDYFSQYFESRDEQTDQQQITLYMLPQPPILEKNIIVNSPEFISEYHKITSKVYTNPNTWIGDTNDFCEEPLDLTISKEPLDLEIVDFMENLETADIPEKQIDDVVEELCSPYVPIQHD